MIEELIKSRRSTLFWLFLVVPVLIFIALRHSLKLALFGDDWLQFWIIKFQFGKDKVHDPLDIHNYIGPYNIQYAILGILSHFFGYNSFIYFFVSMILRILAAIGIYFIAFEMTKNRLAGFFASAFFGVSAIGLDTTNWVFNMNSYMGIMALSPFVVFLIRSRTQGWIKFFISWVSFLLAAILVPVRMHGIFFLVFFTELVWFLRSFKKKIFFQFLTRQAFFIFGGFLLKHWQAFGNMGSSYDYRFKDNLRFLFSGIIQGNKPELAFPPFVVVGNMINALVTRQRYEWADFFQVYLGVNPSLSLVFPLFLLFVFGILLTSFYLTKKKKLFIAWCFGGGFLWTILNDVYLVSNLQGLLPQEFLISSLVGGYFCIAVLGFYLVFFDQKKVLADSLLLALFWIFAFFAVPWFWQPASVLTTEHRYLITPGVGIALSLGCLFALIDQCLKTKFGELTKKKLLPVYCLFLILPVTVFSFLFFKNAVVSNSYLKWLVQIRGAKVYQRVWDSLVSQVPRLDKEGISVFYFTVSADKRGPDPHDVLTFGFNPRMGIIYDIDNPLLLPIPVDNFKELASIVTDGKALKRFGVDTTPVPLDRVYAFELRGSRLVNIRQPVIAELEKAIAVYEKDR